VVNKDSSLFEVEELKGVYLGRCYMACPSRPLPKKDVVMIQIWKFRDIKGFKNNFISRNKRKSKFVCVKCEKSIFT